MKQFDNVNSRYGAPMGRAEGRNMPDENKSIRVFRVRINSGGYDDGGAYWGIGKPLFCATDGADYREFTRADSRLQAIVAMQIEKRLLKAVGPGFTKLIYLESKGCISASGVILRQQLNELGFI